jgi:RND family efflux transporter MFP subunit
MNVKHSVLIGTGALAAVIGAILAARGAPAAEPIPLRPALTVATETPKTSTLEMQLTANGNVVAWQEASVGAEANGLRLSEVRVNVGDVVKRGQIIAVFASETVAADLAQAEAAVAEAEASAADAVLNAERARGLQATGAVSEQYISQLLTAERTALARVKAQRAIAEQQRLRMSKTQVLAPDDGIISARNATVGAVVPAGQELFRLIRQGRLEWRAEVTAAELAQLEPGIRTTLTTPNGTLVRGSVRMVAPTVDPQTRLGLVYVDLPADSVLRAGMFASGAFRLGDSAALTVPQQAIVVRDGFSYVFQLDGDNRVRQMRVRTGRRVGNRVEVSDIPQNATLVTSGTGFLNDRDVVKVVEAPAANPRVLHALDDSVRVASASRSTDM